jgi:hypothetical protein
VGLESTSLLDAFGQTLAGYDAEANRARTSHGNRLREIVGMGLQRKRSLADNFASTGNIHSGANLRAQGQLAQQTDQMSAEANQSLADRLANIARQKIQSETGFNINSLMPR